MNTDLDIYSMIEIIEEDLIDFLYSLEGFPRVCGISSEILYSFLKEQYPELKMIAGTYNNIINCNECDFDEECEEHHERHYWLQYGEDIIDMTWLQFHEDEGDITSILYEEYIDYKELIDIYRKNQGSCIITNKEDKYKNYTKIREHSSDLPRNKTNMDLEEYLTYIRQSLF